PQSIAALHNPEYSNWLERQSAREHVSTQGIIISFRLSQVAKDLGLSRNCITALHKLNINTMIDDFTDHPAAIKILKAMGNRYISVSASLLKAEDTVIKKLIDVCHQHSVLILLPGINRAENVNLYWSYGADLLEGAYIHPVTEDTSFSFKPVIV
ncbi:MAG TPA: EAL domain-containing protein, partial [Thiolapillus brandeum]|nr:EAL domain-containing protein [Thiolapillus brandeum]